MPTATNYTELIRNIPDFPQKGILFRDITPLLLNAEAFGKVIKELSAPYKKQQVDQIAAIEARGYILGAPMAAELKTGFVPVRKIGKLPFQTLKAEYALEYGSATIEMHEDALQPGQRVLLVDDVLATGGTLAATIQLVEQTKAVVAGIAVLIELEALGGRQRLKDYPLFSLIKY